MNLPKLSKLIDEAISHLHLSGLSKDTISRYVNNFSETLSDELLENWRELLPLLHLRWDEKSTNYKKKACDYT